MRSIVIHIAVLLGFAQGMFVSASDWRQHQDMLKTRIIAASKVLAPEGKLLLAWEAKLAPGWKTYWRSPGEAGLPVRVFTGNTEQEVLYPLPERFELFGLETYGYGKYVVLPFLLDAKGAEPKVDVDVDFMVCKEICVPFNTKYTVELPRDEDVSIHDEKIAKWLKHVPEPEGGDGAGLEIISAKVMGSVGHQKLIVDVKADTALAKADMLAEVEGMFHFGKPKLKLLADGHSARFVLPAMAGKMPEDLRGRSVRLTFTNSLGASIERVFELSGRQAN